MKKIILAVLAAAVLAGEAAAQAEARPAALSTGMSASFCDPAFQDFAETTIGYMNPRTGIAARLRDSVAAPAKDQGYVFVSILPRGGDYAALLRELTAGGFVFKGERVRVVRGERQTRLVGWARAGSLESIKASAGVAAVVVGRRKASL